MNMENAFNKKPLAHEIKVQDVEMFGKLLLRTRSVAGKSAAKISGEIPTNKSNIAAWENARAFPEDDKIPAIVKAYGIPEEELKMVLKISREARELEKSAKRAGPLPKRPSQPDFPPSSGEKVGRRY